MIAHRFSSLAALLCSAALSMAAAGCTTGVEPGDYQLLRVAYAEIQADATCYADGEVPRDIKDDSTSFRTGGTLVLFRGPDETYYLDTEKAVMEGKREGDTYSFEGESVDVEYLNGKPAVVMLDTDHDGLDDNGADSQVDADADGLDDDFQDDLVDVDGDGMDDRYEDQEVDVDGNGKDDRFTEIEPATDGDKHTMTTVQTVSFTVSGSDVTGNLTSSIQRTCSGATCPEELPSCATSVAFVGTLVEDVDVEHQL